MVTGRRPFEHVERDAAVIQKVLTGNRPDRPTVGFSEPLWALLNKTWLEERESSPPVRPDIADILELLEYEAQTWSPTGRLLAPPMRMDRKASCKSSIYSELAHVWLTTEPQRGVPYLSRSRIKSWAIQVGFRRYPREEAPGSSRFPKDDFEDVVPPDVGGSSSEFNDILKDIDDIIGPERPDDHSEDRDISAWDKQTSPIVSSVVESREAKQTVEQPRATPSPLPPIPPTPPPQPQERPVAPRMKKKSVVSKAWSKFRKLLMKKFGGDHPPAKLSDKLAPEREDEARRYETLFAKSPQPAKTRKKA